MSFDEFGRSLGRASLPEGLSLPLQALWHDARGDWTRAHECAQQVPGPAGALVHAYLHRKEGDAANAGYWYAHAGRSMPDASLEEEWESIARKLVAE